SRKRSVRFFDSSDPDRTGSIMQHAQVADSTEVGIIGDERLSVVERRSRYQRIHLPDPGALCDQCPINISGTQSELWKNAYDAKTSALEEGARNGAVFHARGYFAERSRRNQHGLSSTCPQKPSGGPNTSILDLPFQRDQEAGVKQHGLWTG